jgi:hypothetical protein
MAFIGNDIVDLTDSGNMGKSRDKRFLQRVFTEAERACITAAAAPDVILWALWAAKETAYKVVRKIDPSVASTPRLYPVVMSPDEHDPARSGMVYTPQGPVVIRVAIAPDHLHCIGATPLPGILDHVLWDVERLCQAEDGGDPDPSLAVRRLAGRRLAALLDVSEADIAIRRCQDIDQWAPPAPYLGEKSVPFDLSLSHDGAFVAYAMIPAFCRRVHPTVFIHYFTAARNCFSSACVS